VLNDRLIDREIEPLDIGKLLLGHAGKLVTVLDDGHIAAAAGLLRAQRSDDVGARLLGPLGARLDHAAGGQRADRHVGPKHQKLVFALRQSELDVGILPRLHASAERHGGGQRQCRTPFTHWILHPRRRVARPCPTLQFAFHA